MFSEVENYIKSMNIGVPGQIDGSEYYEYSFPSDLETLGLQELGTWQLLLGGWEGYVVSQLGRAEAELSTLKAYFDLAIENVESDRKLTVKEKQSRALGSDAKLQKVKTRIVFLSAICAWLVRLSEAYKRQSDKLSRELTRRQFESSFDAKSP